MSRLLEEDGGGAEKLYDYISRYLFARKFLEGKTVLDLGSETGYGTRILSEAAERVSGVDTSEEATSYARSRHSSANLSYEVGDDLTRLTYADGAFDAVVSFEVLERLRDPEELVAEARRVLKKDGVFIVSTPDKQTHSNERNHKDPAHRREMYVPEFRELLERYFEKVSVYRQGAVAGTLTFKDTELSSASVESGRFSLADLSSADSGVPTTRFVVAVCSDSEISLQDERPCLILDRDRRVFDECEDWREEVQLLREEILQMQETEVQAFRDTLQAHRKEAAVLKDRIKVLETRLHSIESSRSWQAIGLYRRLRTKISSPRKPG